MCVVAARVSLHCLQKHLRSFTNQHLDLPAGRHVCRQEPRAGAAVASVMQHTPLLYFVSLHDFISVVLTVLSLHGVL